MVTVVVGGNTLAEQSAPSFVAGFLILVYLLAVFGAEIQHVFTP